MALKPGDIVGTEYGSAEGAPPRAHGVARRWRHDAIAIKSRLSYPNENRGEVDCAAMVTAAPGKDGSYSAAVGKDHEGRLDIIRFRLQGNTLRIVRWKETGVMSSPT
jgi:hypothetical protein